ncbi:MAG: hypothetical protein BWX52_01743 [Bacteroidetes bacterium ADurb.Bin013]|nr:MAG: hypothetical protein BWX52_01743 [Bacteroidetes bacterium ADurb.Bin013]
MIPEHVFQIFQLRTVVLAFLIFQVRQIHLINLVALPLPICRTRLVPECNLQECTDVGFGNGHLVFRTQKLTQVIKIDVWGGVIGLAPFCVELTVICSPYVNPGHESVKTFRKMYPVELAHALVGRHIGIVRALDGQVIHVGEGGAHASGLVLSVTRGDCNDRTDVEIEIKHLVGIVGIVRQPVEQRGMAHGFPTPRMAYEGYALHVHFPVERIALLQVPLLPYLQVFEQHPATRIVLSLESLENISKGTVQKIFIHRGQDISPGSQQPAEVFVPRIGKVLRLVVTVYNEHQREWSFTLRIPDLRVKWQFFFVKSKIPGAQFSAQALP